MKVREVVLANLQLKVWSLVIGALIYVGIHSVIQEEVTLEIPVQVRQGEGRDQFHLNQKTRRVRAVFRGPGTQIEALDRNSLQVIVNIDTEIEGGGKAGPYSIRLKRSHLSLPSQVDVEFRDKAVDIELTQMKTVRVKVEPVMEFDTPFEYSLRYSRPQLVTVRGPQDVVENLESIRTLPARDKIEYTSLNQVEAELVTDVDGTPIQVSPGKVILHLNVSEKQEEHVMKGFHVAVLSNPGDNREIVLDTRTIDLVVTGPPRLKDGTLLREIDPTTITVFVDVRGLPLTESDDPPTRKVFVTSKYGAELKLVPQPNRITVRVKKAN